MSEELARKVEEAVKKFSGRWPVLRGSKRMLERRGPAMEELPEEALEALREAKRRSLEKVEENLEKLRKVVEEHGAEFHLAKNADEARKIISEICKKHGVKLVVKTKSMTTEEIELNKALEAEGVEVVETDLGERIVQLAGEKPSHILAPALHKTKEEIAALFAEKLGVKVELNAQSIVSAAREHLRGKYLSADMVITGANALVAENGALVMVTNEGNDRLAVAFAPIHVVVAGVEKLMETLPDALKVVRVVARSATGQRLSTYVSFQSVEGLAYPKKARTERRKLYFILIDNGRLRARADPELSEALRCMRCAACFNVCPPYNLVGGHVFGHIYSGPMGVAWTTITHGIERAEFSQLCNACGLCYNACPLQINTPLINSVVKRRQGELRGYPEINQRIIRYESLLGLASKAAPISNKLLNSGRFRALLERFLGIDRRSPLPKLCGKPLRREDVEGGGGEAGKVALFTDSLIKYSNPRLGAAAADLLKELGFKAALPEQRGSGMPLIQYGFFDKAVENASYNVRSLSRYVREGYVVVALEPTARLCLTEYYPRLLGSEDARLVANHSFDLFGFLAELGSERLGKVLKRLDGRRVLYHLPCHARRPDGRLPVKELLEGLGAEVVFKDLGCCGLAGSWGMRRGGWGYAISSEIGRMLAREYEATGAELITADCSACILQLSAYSSLPVKHPLELIYDVGR